MAKLLEKALDFFGWETNYDDDEEELYEEEIAEASPYKNERERLGSGRKSGNQGKVLNMNSNNSYKVVVVSPQNILEVRELCDHLKANKPVIMNVEGADTALAQRMVDFLSGSVYCLDGDIQKISSGIFLATPANIEITGDLKDDIKNKGVFSWVK